VVSGAAACALFFALAPGRHARLARHGWLAAFVTLALLRALLSRCQILFDASQPFAVADGHPWMVWRAALPLYAAHPLLGVGPGDPVVITALPPRFLEPAAWDAHLLPLSLLLAAGPVALGGFCAMLITALRRGLRAARSSPLAAALVAAVAAVLLDGLSADAERFRHLWLLLGLLAAESAQPRPVVS
jgi:hypothetical protein